MSDLKFAFRQLLKPSGSKTVAVLTLAPGIQALADLTVTIVQVRS